MSCSYLLNDTKRSVGFTVADIVLPGGPTLVLPGLCWDEASFLGTDDGYDCAWENDDVPYIEVSYSYHTLGSGEVEDPSDEEIDWLKDNLPLCAAFVDTPMAGSFYVNNPFFFTPKED